MDYVDIGKKKMRRSAAKKIRIVYLILGWFIVLLGIIALPVGGIFFSIIGILLLINCHRYSKALKADAWQKQSTNIPVKPIAPKLTIAEPISTSKVEIKPVTPVSASKPSSDTAYKIENHNVAGVTFQDRQKQIRQMGFENDDYRLSKKDFIDAFSEYEKVYAIDFDPVKVELVEEPDNPHDSNAIKVIVDGIHVGYIKSGSCTHIKNLLHSDSIISISAEIHGGDYKYYSEEYDEDKCDDVCKIEKGSSNYFVTLQIKTKA